MTQPMTVHADGVDVADDSDTSGPWVAVNLYDADDETDRDEPDAVLTLTSTEARDLAASLVDVAESAEAKADGKPAPAPASTYTDSQVLGLLIHEASDHDRGRGECVCTACRILRATGHIPALPNREPEPAAVTPEATHHLVNHTNDIGDWCPFSGVSVKADADGCPQGCRDGYIEED